MGNGVAKKIQRYNTRSNQHNLGVGGLLGGISANVLPQKISPLL